MALIIPEVFADTVNEKLNVSFKMAQLATDVTNQVADITTCGDKIHFPTFDRVAKVSEVTKGKALVPAEVSMTDNVADIKQTGGSIRVYDVDATQIKGATYDAMAQQLTDAMVADIDTALGATIDAEAKLKSGLTNTDPVEQVTYTDLVNALGFFGDQVDYDSFAGIAINSKLLPSFLQMNEFVSVEKTYNRTNDNGLIKNGLVGYFLNIPVVLTNNATYDDKLKETKTYIIKKGALGYVLQKGVTVETEREAKLLATDIVVSDLYATKVMDKDGIVVMRKTIA